MILFQEGLVFIIILLLLFNFCFIFQGVATVYGSVEDLPQAVTCIGLGPEDKLKKQVIAAGSGSLLMFLNSTVRRWWNMLIKVSDPNDTKNRKENWN